MAEATKTGPLQRSVRGDTQYFGWDSVAFAANGDTLTLPFKKLFSIDLTPTTNTAYGFTVSYSGGNTILTLVSGGALMFQGGASGK